MATSFKTLGSSDVQSTRNKLHEAIPITGSITSGTYGDFPDEENIKNYPHGMFQSCYDYPYLSSSANHIFDLTVGYGITANSLSASTNTQQEQKLNMYAQMAQVLSGYDTTGSIKAFNAGIIEGTTLSIQDAIFVNFALQFLPHDSKNFFISVSVTFFLCNLNASSAITNPHKSAIF